MKTLFGTEFEVTVFRVEHGDGHVDQYTIERGKKEETTDYWKRCCRLFIEGLGDDLTLRTDVMNMIYLWYCMFRTKNVENMDELSLQYSQVVSSDEYNKLKDEKIDDFDHILMSSIGDINEVIKILKKNDN